MDSAFLNPVLVDEMLPGDTFKCRLHTFVRTATPIHPVMDNLTLESFAFFIPLRLLWGNFRRFMGEQINPGDSVDFTIPQMVSPAGGYQPGSLADFFGLPTQVAGISHSALYHRAYAAVFNQWFRSEDLVDSAFLATGDGPDDPASYPLQKRMKRPDYFTSLLPFAQKGPAVRISAGTEAPVISDGTLPSWQTFGSTGPSGLGATGATANWVQGPTQVGGVGAWANTGLKVDLENSEATTINEMREAFQLQKLLERDARGGTRYPELVWSHYRVSTGDARLNRPEYIGGGRQTIQMTTVPQTSETATGSQTPQGNLAAYGTSQGSGHRFNYTATEHGIVMMLVNIRADLHYTQGIERQFTRKTKYDFYWPALAHLGEQPVYNREIYAQGASADDLVFGFGERFSEYRFKQSRITGKFRSSDPQPLDAWHYAQNFDSLPTLGQTFITEDPPIKRTLAVQTEPEFLFDGYFELICHRPMPTFSVPGLIDHF